ncbi:MAG: B12-binding domain-containing radical SAM protein [Candidatus Omnitrophota bacterium]
MEMEDHPCVLLIYPEYPDTFWSFKHALKFVSKKAAFPPLGLLTVAAMLPKHWKKTLIDLNVRPLTDADLNGVDLAFISAMAVQRDSTLDVIRRCKEKKIKMVAGGPLFTTQINESEMDPAFDAVDYLILGEVEGVLPTFLKDLETNRAKKIYKKQEWPSIETSPIPAWELLDMKHYDSMSIQYSRGCPFKCEFCDILILNGNRPRTKTTGQILNELETLYNHGWRGAVFIVDDNFIGNRVALKKELLPAMIEWMDRKKHPFFFFTEASLDLTDDDELIRSMVRSGFRKVFIGIETPHEDSLAECNKFANRNRNMLASIQKLQQNGLEVQGGFIVGFDNDPVSIFEKQIRFIQRSGIVTAMVGLLTAMKGTRLYERLEKENRLLHSSTGNNTDFSINFVPKMNRDVLLDGYRSVVKTIYSPGEYYKRILIFFKHFHPLKWGKNNFRFIYVGAFLRSIWYIGIRNKERKYYWKLISWTLRRRPKLFAQAIEFSILGFHFRKVFEV